MLLLLLNVTSPEGVQCGERHSVLQRIWWDRSLDNSMFSGTNCLVPSLPSLHIYVLCYVHLLQSSPPLCDLMDWSPPGSFVHGIFQATILEWVPISFSRGSSWPRDQTHVSCLASEFFNVEPPWKPIPIDISIPSCIYLSIYSVL